MNIRISNRLAFTMYIWGRLVILIALMVYLILLFYASLSRNDEIIRQTEGYITFLLPCAAVVVLFIDYVLRPTFFEAKITSDQIAIKSFSPFARTGFFQFAMLSYRKHLTEYYIDRQSYNNYKIQIGRLGLRKNLILQKIKDGRIYESKPIMIHFLCIKKYTELILSIDRLKEKITLN